VSEWHDVGSAGDLDERGVLLARVGGREIGVLRDRATGAVHAVRNRCPHHGAPLCLGTVRDRLGGRPAQYVAAGRRVLHCPWHGWEFELDSGRCPDDERMRVAVYPVKIESGRVLIDA
jgi:nitrite reductase (NADH) small subunit